MVVTIQIMVNTILDKNNRSDCSLTIVSLGCAGLQALRSAYNAKQALKFFPKKQAKTNH
jgi:RNase adaptor protein for sRNA GlmZ degradation